MRYNPCGHQESVAGCKECVKWDTLPKYRAYWRHPSISTKPRRVSLCIGYIDGDRIQSPSNRDYRRCSLTGKIVCPCKDCTTDCPKYETE